MIDAEQLERARGADLMATAVALGARLKRVTAAEWAGPCPRCGGRDRFAVNVSERLWGCRGCAKCAATIRMRCARRSWRVPAGASPAQERGSAGLVASVAARKATTAAKRTQQLCGVRE